MNKLEQNSGFTLIEMMISIAVLGIIVTIAAPSFSTMIKNNRLATVTNDLYGTLQFARAEAVRRGGGVRVSAISDDVNNGLHVWVDDGDNNFESGEELRIFRLESSGHYMSVKEGVADSQDLSFTFNARGFTNGLNDNVTIGICDDREGSYGRRIALLTSGSMRLSTNVACGGGEE